jgi:hypothetical protein
VPTPEPGFGAPTPVPGAGVPIPDPGAGVAGVDPGAGVPSPPLFVAGAHGSTLVPLLIVVGLAALTDPVVPLGATLPALPEVPTVGVVDDAPGAAGADVPGRGGVGAVAVGVLDVVLSAVVAGALAVVPGVDAAMGGALGIAGAGAPFRGAAPLPTVGVPAGVPVTPATPGAVGSHGVTGVARWLV